MVLAEKDAARIRRRIIDKCPDQLKPPFALWTREAVRDLIERETEVRLSLQSVSDYLKRWGFTPQRPVKRATERSEPAIAAWLATDYPAIVKRAKRENAEIQWADETGLSNQANYGRSFAPRGMTPVVRRLAARFSQSMISESQQPRLAALHGLRRRAQHACLSQVPAPAQRVLSGKYSSHRR